MLDPRETTRITVEELVANPWLTEGYTEPIPRVGPVQGSGPRTVSEDVVEFISRVMKTPEKELRRVIHSRKPNSFAAMHDLLLGRLEKGLGFPTDEGHSKEVETPGHEGQENNRNTQRAREGSLALASQNCNDTSFINKPQHNQSLNGSAILSDEEKKKIADISYANGQLLKDDSAAIYGNIDGPSKICKRCTIKLEAGPKILNGKDTSPEVSYLPSDNLCYKCGKLMSWAENAESVMGQFLHLQKFLPNFQDLITTADGAKTRPPKGSECNDIVSFLSGVDDETFDRALKMLRGYGSLPEPPVPPNSAYEGGRGGNQCKDNVPAEGSVYSSAPGPNSKQHYCSFPKTGDAFSMQRKLGNNINNTTFLNVLPPIAKLGGDLPRDPTSLAEERLLQAAQRRQATHGLTEGNPRRSSVLFNEHSISGRPCGRSELTRVLF